MHQPSKDSTGIPPSIHMHLGRGLSSLVRSRHTSCFDLDQHVELLRPSFSESDLSSLFDKQEIKKMELDLNRMQSASETYSSEHADAQDIEMRDGNE